MRQRLVAGNWKMHGSRAENTALLDGLLQSDSAKWRCEVAVCPPFIYIPDAVRRLKESTIAVGAQNVSVEPV